MTNLNFELVLFPELDQPVEHMLPVLVAGEIVVGEEEAADAARIVLADHLLDVVGRAPARDAALHVDDRAERALIGAAAAGIERRIGAGDAVDHIVGEVGDRLAGKVRQILHVIVDRLRGAGPDFLEQRLVTAVLRLAGEDRAADVDGLLDVRRDRLQHRKAAGDMEAADRDGDARRAEAPRDMHGARKLVRLDADEAKKRAVRRLHVADELVDRDEHVRLVEGLVFDLDILAEHLAARAVAGQRVEAAERIGGDAGCPPLDDVAVGIVARRLDQRDGKPLWPENP